MRDPDGKRQYLSQKLRDDSYRVNDQRGHLIADLFGGPATKENVVAQLDNVNQSKMRKIEEQIKSLKQEGHRVDYSVKSNYVGTEKRPSSFEVKITVDGKEIELPKEQRKIYNSDINDQTLSSTFKRASIEVGERFGIAHEEGLNSAKLAAAITCSVSSYENISAFINGEIDAETMVTEIVTDTAAAGGAAYATTFVTEAVANTMAASSNELIRAVGGSSIPALVVSFGVQSFDDISDYAQGKIDGGELAYNLGENAAEVGGGAAGGAIVGAQIGTFAGPVGTVAGTIIGGAIGCAVASEAYATAVELGSEGAEILADRVEKMANTTIEATAESMPEQVDSVRDAFNDYFETNNLPFSV